MRSGRPHTWNIAESFSGDTWTGIVELTSKDRLQLPSSARKRVAWLKGGANQQALVEIQGDAVELRPWSEAGAELVARLEEIAQSLSAERLQELVIAAMDRYARLSVGADGRMVLPAHLAHHLDATAGEVVRIVVSDGRIWLWSEASWRKDRQSRYLNLDKLLQSSPTNR